VQSQETPTWLRTEPSDSLACSLSMTPSSLAASSEDEQRRVHNALDQLPAQIGLLSMRRLVPVMAALPGQLNLLTAEAVAAAVVLGARIAVSTASPLLTAAADSVGVGLDVVDLGL
jgi:hypothetical protein